LRAGTRWCHVLVNNAAVASKRRTLSPDGIEMTVAVNHLAYFTLTLSLLDRILAAAPARIVNVSSGSHPARTTRLRRPRERERLRRGEVLRPKQADERTVHLRAGAAARGHGSDRERAASGVIGTRLLVTYFPRFLQPIVSRVTGRRTRARRRCFILPLRPRSRA
jgi:hypothetical protein